MRTLNYFLIIVLSLAVGACTKQSLPTFTDPMPISVPSEQPAIGPRLAQSADGSLILSWMERKEDAATLRFSRYNHGSWQAPSDVVTDARMFVNWADLPAVTPTNSGALLAHWLSYTAGGTYTYQILTAHSTDDGESWSEPTSPHTDGTDTEHGFVSLYPNESGMGLVWLDGRNTPDAGMTLRTATLAEDGSISDESLLDSLICDCCQTDVAVAAEGAIAVYRDRTEDEIRDIYVARRLDGQWQAGVPVAEDNWNISGCPVNGPVIVADGKLVVVAWFTAADNNPIVKSVVSTNAGKTFSEPVVVSAENPMGRVGVALIDASSYAVSWLQTDGKGTYAINVRSLTIDGQIGPINTVGRTEVARAVPQMVRENDTLVLAWTGEMNELTKVVSVELPIIGFYD